MVASLFLAAVLFAPGASRLPAHCPATTVARVFASLSAFPEDSRTARPAVAVDVFRGATADRSAPPQLVPLVLTTQLRR